MDLNGEVPQGPLDAFFMSRPRYTPRHKRQASRPPLAVCLALAHATSSPLAPARWITLVTSSPPSVSQFAKSPR